MASHPGFFTRLMARAHGEVSAEMLEAYRQAGASVYDLLRETEDRRLALKIQGIDPWKIDPGTQAFFLCAWNAFTLQTLGDSFLDADYGADPQTEGFLPPVTAVQVHAFYAPIEEWLSRGRQASTNPAYQLDLHLPADLPCWAEVEPCPRAHLEAMVAVTEIVRTHAEAAFATFEPDRAPPDQLGTVQKLRQLTAAAGVSADYAKRLLGDQVSAELHEQIERHVKDALGRYYQLGQALAMPKLIDLILSPPSPAPITPVAHLPRPREAGFDPWCLTDSAARKSFVGDSRARESIAQLWQNDPSPQRTLAIQAEIDAALARGDIAYQMNSSGQRLGHYYCCPWGAIYLVKRPVTIGGTRYRPLQQFVFDVSAEGVTQGSNFKREIVVSTFQPTTKIDYCDPREADHDEE